MNDNNLGFSDKPDPNAQTLPQAPIILPAPQEQEPYGQQQRWDSGSPLSASGQWMPPQGRGFSNPGTKRSRKNDPAYRVLLIAIGVVVLSLLASVVVFAAVFNQPSSQTAQGGGPQTASVHISSPMPTAAPTPTPTSVPTPTPTPMPTPTPAPAFGPLTVNIGSTTVRNGRSVTVKVTGSKPGATVTLEVTYNNAASSFVDINNNPQDADDAGDATFSWTPFVGVAANQNQPVTAVVQARAQDQHGYSATSSPVSVTVQMTGF